MGRIQIRSGNLKKFAVCRYLYTTVTYKLDGLPAQQVISDMGDLSISLNGRGYRKEALDLMAEARNILRAAPPAVPENDIGETWVGLAFNDIKLGDLKAAEDDVARGMACKIGLGSSKLHRLRCRTAICLEKRDFRQAEVLGLELHKRLLATDRPDVPLDLRGESSRMLFDTLCAQKKFEQARRCLAEDIEDLKKRLPESKPLLMHQFNTLQGFYRSRHDHASVDAVMEQMKPYESDPFVQNQIPSCRSQSQK